MKTIYLTILSILTMPIVVLAALERFDAVPQETIFIGEPSLFSGKWERVAYSHNFSEYVEPTKFEKNIDGTIEIVTLRNYFRLQFDEYGDKKISYKSAVSYETVDCFSQTVTVNKIFFLGGHFAKGSIVAEPIEPLSTPIHVLSDSIGFSKIRNVCEITNLNFEPKYTRSDFMINI